MNKSILLSAQNLSSIGGSEMYHYELARELNLKGYNVYLYQYNSIIHDIYFFNKIKEFCKDIFLREIPADFRPDLILTSQPNPTLYILSKYRNTNIPILSVIHSEIRSEDPIIDSRINGYIAIRPTIQEMLIEKYKLNNVHLIYNPIDLSRFNNTISKKTKYRPIALFVGEVLDNIRIRPATDFANTYIDKQYEIHFVSKSRFYEYDSNYIKFHDPHFNIEYLLSMADITGGIVSGRTQWESIAMGIPHVNYWIDITGNITDIELIKPGDISIDLFDSKQVVNHVLKVFKELL